MKNNPQPNKTLTSQGIERITDNIGDDQQMHVSGYTIFSFFRQEIQQRFMTGGEHGRPFDKNQKPL